MHWETAFNLCSNSSRAISSACSQHLILWWNKKNPQQTCSLWSEKGEGRKKKKKNNKTGSTTAVLRSPAFQWLPSALWVKVGVRALSWARRVLLEAVAVPAESSRTTWDVSLLLWAGVCPQRSPQTPQLMWSSDEQLACTLAASLLRAWGRTVLNRQ